MTNSEDDCVATVLVVEDETLVRLLANDILTEAGYRVLEARDGQEALTILGVHDAVAAVVTDVTMPNVDGLALAKIVRQRWPSIGVVVTSGLPKPPDLPEGARFIPKPYGPDTVVEVLEAVLAQETPVDRSTASIALTNLVNLHAGRMHGAGGLAQPLREPDE